MRKRSSGHFDSQEKFAKQLRKTKKVTAKQLPMEVDVSHVPMSTEMVDWLADTLAEDDEGHLPEAVSSVMAPPMDSMNLYTPMGALSSSRYAAVKPEESLNEKERRRRREQKINNGFDDFSVSEASFVSATTAPSLGEKTIDSGMMSTSTTWSQNKPKEARPPPLPKEEAMTRLEVTWMQQRAKIEAAEGDPTKALKTLQTALDLHLGGPSTEYKDAHLGDHTLAAHNLYEEIATTYRDFDQTAHFDASRIQRCFLRYRMRRHKRALLLQRVYRGFRQRKHDFLAKEMQKQTVQIIQRRFRKYLAMLASCATLIKRWYKKLKLMEDFKAQKFWFRNAYRLQRLWRGYEGRQVALQKRDELQSTNLIQRLSRAWRHRHQRTQALRLWHKRFNDAARTIQLKMRQVLSVRHAQIQLLREFGREAERMGREETLVEEVVRISLKKTQLYMQTQAGHIHKEWCKERINLKDKLFKKKKPELTPDEILAQEALVSFELFDRDGSGRIDEDELAEMLVQLAIPANEETVKRLAQEIDTDGGGDIDFGEFLEWYTGGGSDEVTANASLEDQMFKQLLKVRTMVLEVSGFILQRRAERDILRQCTSWQSKDVAATFRMTHAPKYQCCQCMEPFVMFADYFDHFNVDGCCKVQGERAMFYPKYWLARDWDYQRQLEFEVRRFNDEVPNVNYHCLMATYLELSLQSDLGVAALLEYKTRQAQVIYIEKRVGKSEPEPEKDPNRGANTLMDAPQQERSDKTMTDEIMDIVNMCGDGHLSPIVVKCVAERLGTKIPEEWILEDTWDMQKMREFVHERVDGEKGIAKRRAKIPYCYEEEQILKAQTWLLADIYVRVVRLMQVAGEASLSALLEFRSRRPRRLTVPDDELDRLNLGHLTSTTYSKSRDVILGRLRICSEAIDRLAVISVSGGCDSLLKKAAGKVQVGPDGKLSKEDAKALLVSDAHILSIAKYRARLKSRIGQTQLHRLASELWALHCEYQADGAKTVTERSKGRVKVKSNYNRRAGDSLFLYELLTNASTKDGVDFWDLDLLQRKLNLTVTAVQMREFRRELDPKDTGYISLEQLVTWMLAGKEGQYFSFFKATTMFVAWSVLNLLSSFYYVHAEDKLLTNLRIRSRLELDYQQNSIEALLLSAKIVDDEQSAVRKELEAKSRESVDPDNLQGAITSSAELEEIAKTPEQREREKEQRKVAADKEKLDLEKEKERLAVLREKAVSAADKITAIKHADEEGESLLLYRLAMYEAREDCMSSFVTAKGFYNLRTERLIMKATRTLVDSMGYTITPCARYPWTSDVLTNKREREELTQTRGSQQAYETGWTLAVQQLVYAFDTDCSGNFDEGEVGLLLTCANFGIAERQILFKFPEVVTDSVSTDTLCRYLAPRVLWGRGWLSRFGFNGGAHILSRPDTIAAGSMLVSLSMQRALQTAQEATALTRTGELGEEEDDRNDEAVMVRSQLFAMRQVVLFLRTVQGRQKIKLTKKKVKYWWKEDVWGAGAGRQGLLNYAFMVHKDTKGVLITELPHMIAYLVKHFGFSTTREVETVAEMVYQCKTREDVRWFNQAQAMELLDRVIARSSLPWRACVQGPNAFLSRLCNVHRDAKLNMLSRARQQAVLISLRFEGILVADTNYRCSALGLNDVMSEISATSSWGILRKKNVEEIDWKNVPREAIHFLMLSHGYAMDDFLIDGMEELADIEHNDGGIAADLVNVPEALVAAKLHTNRAFTGYTGYLQKARRWGNFLTQATGGLVAYYHYFRVAKAIKTEGRSVNREGAKYLRELLTGQSHCVSGE